MNRHQKNAVHHDCDFCDAKFCNERDYGIHQVTVHHVNPRICKICSKEYKTVQDLRKHRVDATPEQCNECELVFCHKREMDFHRMTHTGEGIRDLKLENILDQQICSSTGFEDTKEYKEKIKEMKDNVKDSIKEKKNIYAHINKEISPQFTYRDLYNMLNEEVKKYGKTCKINIGFGVILKSKLNNVYRYYYVSANHLLLDKSFTISTREDMNAFIRIIYDQNVCETSYFRRPDSSWIVAGLPNVMLRISFLGLVFG